MTVDATAVLSGHENVRVHRHDMQLWAALQHQGERDIVIQQCTGAGCGFMRVGSLPSTGWPLGLPGPHEVSEALEGLPDRCIDVRDVILAWSAGV
ncbi:MAG: hypothetical protein U0R81_16880 [Mycobacterium sp.]